MQDVVRRAQAEFDRAELEGDRQALSRLIADDFKSIGPKGFVLDKRQWIDRHGLFKYQALETSEVDVRVYGAAAIVRNVQRNRATYEGHPVALTVRVSQVWIAQPDGQWRIVAIQFSPMADDESG
jgi:ketosteroid isomerase-like protein